MSTRAIMIDSARLALQDRAHQAAAISDSLTKIERSASAIPNQIEVAAERLTTLAAAMATLISESEAALKRHQTASEQITATAIEISEAKKSLVEQTGVMETMRENIVKMSDTIGQERDLVIEARKAITRAATVASSRQWTTGQAVAAIIATGVISGTLSSWPAWIMGLIALATR